MTGSGLSPIEPVVKRRWFPPSPLQVLGASFTLFSASLWFVSADETWGLRGDDAFSNWWYLVAAILCVVVPPVVIWVMLRKDLGWSMVPALAFIMAIVIWLSHVMFRFISQGLSPVA